MRRIFTSVLIISTFLMTALYSCKKDNITDTSIRDTSQHVFVPRPTEIEMTVFSWNNLGQGFYSSTLYDVISQLNTTHTSTIKVYLMYNGNATSLDKPVQFNNGILKAKVQSTDVILFYQSFVPGNQPNYPITIKIVAQ